MLPAASVVEGDPSLLLQQCVAALLGLSEDDLPADPRVDRETPVPVALSVTHLARSILLDHFARPERARTELWNSVWRDPVRARGLAARRLARSAAFDDPRVNFAARLVTGSLRRVPVATIRRRAWSYHLLFNETHGTRLQIADEIRSQQRRDPPKSWSFATGVSAASHLKLLGDLEEVRRLVGVADLAEQRPSLRGKGAYNLLWAIRNQGLLSEWSQLWEDHVQRAALLDPNWAAWFQIEAADMACMLGDIDSSQSALASTPIEFARKRRQHLLLLIDADTSRARAAALAGAPLHDTARGIRRPAPPSRRRPTTGDCEPRTAAPVSRSPGQHSFPLIPRPGRRPNNW